MIAWLMNAWAQWQEERLQCACGHVWWEWLSLDPAHPHPPDAPRTTCRLCGALSCWRCRGTGRTWPNGTLMLAWGSRCQDCSPPGSGRASAEQRRVDAIMHRIPVTPTASQASKDP